MIYSINSCIDADDKIHVSRQFCLNNNLNENCIYNLSIGKQTKGAKVIIDSRCRDDELRVSKGVMEYLHIPDGIRFQLKITGDIIRLGPVIGLLMGLKTKSIKKGMLRQMLNYTKVYSKLGGLLFVFCEEGIDYKSRLIEGYFYSPDRRPESRPWEKALLPFPDSIFQRIILPDETIKKLKKLTDNRMFNSRYFNKWKFWELVSRYDDIREHIPYTKRVVSFDDIKYMLTQHKCIYLKPINGTLARGLVRVLYDNGSYLIKAKDSREDSEVHSEDELFKELSYIVENKNYIAQQALYPVMLNDRPIDFRVIMQKDDSLNWQCTGIVAFIGMHGGICSNWGFVTTFDDALIDALNFSRHESYTMKQEVIGICRKICTVLDSTGENYGDLGFDVLIDVDLNVWVLEANKKHYHSVPLWIKDRQTFYAVKANPIKYAAALAGFEANAGQP